MNIRIRKVILKYVAMYRIVDTRWLTKNLSLYFKTTKQRIAGNISYLVTSGRVQINRNYPHSTIY